MSIIDLIMQILRGTEPTTPEPEIIEEKEPEIMELPLNLMDVLTSSGAYPDREQSEECNELVRFNAEELIKRVNPLLAELGISDISVNSGFRTAASNSKTKGGAKKSSHMAGQAVDLHDPDNALEDLVTAEILTKFDLYKEAGTATPGWVHLTTRAPGSKRRIFNP